MDAQGIAAARALGIVAPEVVRCRVLGEVFNAHLRRLRQAYFEKHTATISKGISDLMKYLAGYESSLAVADCERAP